jgi:hypothetical protein
MRIICKVIRVREASCDCGTEKTVDWNPSYAHQTSGMRRISAAAAQRREVPQPIQVLSCKRQSSLFRQRGVNEIFIFSIGSRSAMSIAPEAKAEKLKR